MSTINTTIQPKIEIIAKNSVGDIMHYIPRKIFYRYGKRFMNYRGQFAQLRKIYSRDKFFKTYEIVDFLQAI